MSNKEYPLKWVNRLAHLQRGCSLLKVPMRARLTLSLVLAAAIFSPLGAQTVIRYEDFTSQSGLTLNDAVAADGTIMLASSQKDRRGSFFTSLQYDVSDFSAVFQFRISSPGGLSDGVSAGADGLAFVIQRAGATALGSFGEGLGYKGISNSLAVEFDTYRNDSQSSSANDPDSNHIGINTGGSITSLATVGVATAFDSYTEQNPTIWTVWVDYNGSALEVRASTDGFRPSTATLAYSVNLSSVLGGSAAHIGFTGATGSAFGNHEILNFAFSDTFEANGLAVPEPSTYALMGLGLVVVGWSAWRRRR